MNQHHLNYPESGVTVIFQTKNKGCYYRKRQWFLSYLKCVWTYRFYHLRIPQREADLQNSYTRYVCRSRYLPYPEVLTFDGVCFRKCVPQLCQFSLVSAICNAAPTCSNILLSLWWFPSSLRFASSITFSRKTSLPLILGVPLVNFLSTSCLIIRVFIKS